MSIQSEIERIKLGKEALKSKLNSILPANHQIDDKQTIDTFGSHIEFIGGGNYNIEVIDVQDANGNKYQELHITDVNSSTELGFDRTFANNTPAQISAVSAEIEKNGYTSEQVKEIFGWDLKVDTHPIQLTNGETIHVHFDGFLHDEKSDGTGKAGISLGMVDCLATAYVVNSEATNSGGFFAGNLFVNDFETIYELLPDEWKAIIKPVNKRAANGGKTYYTETITQSCKIYLYSEIEIFGTVKYAQDGANEGSVYEYWSGKVASERIKKRDADADGVPETVVSWFLRSSYNNGETYFCSVGLTGEQSINSANSSRGVSFGFCV